jgi:uncharacterized Fe-S cluster-containing protein
VGRIVGCPIEHFDEALDAGVQVVVVDLLAAQHSTDQSDELVAGTFGMCSV